MTDERVGTFEGVWYRWGCPACDAINEFEEDIRGAEVWCEECGWQGKVEP